MVEIKKLRTTQKTKSIEELCKEIRASFGAILICEEKMLNDRVTLLCLERYYFRCGNYVSLSVLLTESEEFQEVVIASFGGGNSIFDINWGANKAFANTVVKILNEASFIEIS